jgi:N,N'-diacetyllegionaminate synthase
MKITIIAEAGVNHNGSLEKAKQLIEVAANAGVDIVKFQTFKADKIVSKTAPKATYQLNSVSDGDDSQYTMLKKLELDDFSHMELVKYCKQKGLEFLSTGFDEESIDFLEEIGSSMYKIPSGEITNKPYLQHIARKGKPVLMSSGMAYLDEIEKALTVMMNEGLNKEMITVLHCNTEYPTPMEDVNLKAMLTIREAFKVNIGYSDHTLGIEVPIAAVALGAVVIEKHFTLDRNLPGPDHKASLEPSELKAMVDAIRNVEMAVSGTGLKMPSFSEQKNISVARKSIVASCPIAQGEKFSKANITAKRPGNGISPMLWDEVIGRNAKRDFDEDELIEL